MSKYFFTFIAVFLFQLIFAQHLAINNIRPDLLIIFVLHLAVKNGNFWGAIFGFVIGVIADLFDVGPAIGVLPLVYLIVGYAGGFLYRQHHKIHPITFYFICLVIMIFPYIIFVFSHSQYLYFNDFPAFLFLWFKMTLCTVIIFTILQLFLPLRKI